MSTVTELYDKPAAENYYGLTRSDVVDFLGQYLHRNQLQPKHALEIGCSSGGTGALIKDKLGVDYYAGLELMPEAAEAAKARLDWVQCGNIEEMIAQNQLGQIPAKPYDVLLFLDVLEHLVNPWKTLAETAKLMNKGGLLVGSIPNAGNLYVLWKLMRDHFEYEEEGLLDRTHLRFFTAHTIKKMVNKDWTFKEMGTRHDTWKTMNWQQKVFYLGTFGQWKRLFIRQYLFIAEVKPR